VETKNPEASLRGRVNSARVPRLSAAAGAHSLRGGNRDNRQMDEPGHAMKLEEKRQAVN